MRFGRSVPSGFLPVYSVETEACAKKLLIATCPRNMKDDFVARELVEEQTLDNLYAFGERLAEVHELLVTGGHCACKGG